MHHHRVISSKKLLFSIIVISIIFLVELIGSILTNSLALLGDAGHMLTDLFALFISFLAIRLAGRPPTKMRTFGFYRFEILAALFNGLLLLLIAIYIFYRSYFRLLNPEPVVGLGLTMVATIGLVANIFVLFLLKSETKDSINVRAAAFHVLSDTISSVAVLVTGLLITFTGLLILDPIIGITIGIIIIYGAFRIIIEATEVLLEATPGDIDPARVSEKITTIDGVNGIHHLHIWSITSDIRMLSAHIEISDQMVSKANEITAEINRRLKEDFDIEHTTIQIECERCQEDIFCQEGECPN
ncbi:MAG TPA: cation transporter [bacterium (Candidatus Stahlbacteria)]|nr:cation transporter [Candidatus Stahlbacteria bacterium]